MPAALLQQDLRPQHIGAHKDLRSGNGAVNMGFGGKMDDRIDCPFLQDGRHQRGIADVTLDKAVVGIVFDRGQVLQVAGIGQAIQVGHVAAGIGGNKGMDKIGADETSASGHENGCRFEWHLNGSPSGQKVIIEKMYHICEWAANKKTLAGQAAGLGACPYDEVGI